MFTRGNDHKLAKHFCYTYILRNIFNNKVIDKWDSLSNNLVMPPTT